MIRLFLIVSSIYASVSATATSCIEADLILHHGNIYTGKTDRSFLGSIASKGSRITYVGKVLSDAAIACSNANIINLNGKYIFPGFTDAHGHLKGIGYRELSLNLQEIPSLNETLQAVRSYLSSKGTGEWVIGRGWIEKVWPEKRFPSRWDLDPFSPDNPVVLE